MHPGHSGQSSERVLLPLSACTEQGDHPRISGTSPFIPITLCIASGIPFPSQSCASVDPRLQKCHPATGGCSATPLSLLSFVLRTGQVLDPLIKSPRGPEDIPMSSLDLFFSSLESHYGASGRLHAAG